MADRGGHRAGDLRIFVCVDRVFQYPCRRRRSCCRRLLFVFKNRRQAGAGGKRKNQSGREYQRGDRLRLQDQGDSCIPFRSICFQ